MLSASTALKTQIDSQVQAPAALVEVDLEGDGLDILDDISPLVESWSIDRTITSDVPDGTRLVAGYATAEANVTLSGADSSGHDAAWVFSPANTLSQYYGKHRVGAPAKIKMGFKAPTTPEYLDRFTGQVRELTTDGAARTASMSFLDVADKLKTLVKLPGVVASFKPGVKLDTNGLFYSGIPAQRPGLSAVWPMDFILRANGIHSTVPPRSEAVLYASMNGSAAPGIGSLIGAWNGGVFDSGASDVTDGDVCTFGPGNFGRALTPVGGVGVGSGNVVVWKASKPLQMSTATTVRIEGWVNVTSATPSAAWLSVEVLTSDDLHTANLQVGVLSNRKLYALDTAGAVISSTGTLNVGWNYVAFDVKPTSTNMGTVVFRRNSTTESAQTFNTNVLTSGTAKNTIVRLSGRSATLSAFGAEPGCPAAVEALQMSFSDSAGSWNSLASWNSPTAILEDSLNNLTAIPISEDAREAWPAIQAIAAAEFGVALFDEQGIFRFWNRYHFGSGQSVDYTAKTVTINGVTSPIPTITSDRELKSLSTVESIDSVRNDIQVAVSPLLVQPASWVWQNGDPIRIGIRSSVTVTAALDNPAVAVSPTWRWLGRGLTTDIGDGNGPCNGYRACRRLDGLSDPVTNLQFSMSVSAQTVSITITNPNDYWCYLVSPQQAPSADPTGFTGNYDAAVIGQPYLWLWGQTVSTSQSITDNSVHQSSDATGSYVQVSDSDSIAAYGTQSLSLGNEWVQGTDIARPLATDLLAMLARPAPYLGDTAVLGDPRLQIGDRAELTDSTGSGVSLQAWIVGIPSEEYNSTDGYSQTLTLRLVTGFGGTCFDAPDAKFNSSIFDGVY